MAKRAGAHRIEKRSKELKRLKKQEEKRLRRQQGRAQPDAEPDAEAGAEPGTEEGGENPEAIPGDQAADTDEGSATPRSAPV